jgi:putative phage-type endonuclease
MSLIFNYDKDLPKVTPLKEEYLKNQVLTLKNIFQPEQTSKEWYEMRSNMLTASDWGTVLGENHYSNSNEVLKKKCGDDNFVTNAAMIWGNKYEEVAVLIYKNRNNVDVLEFGCLRHPSIPFLGASPDGITPDGIMLEIKCPTSRKITGIPPRYYWCQVQGQLEVCELDRCDFLECALKEYESETDYLNDHFENNYKLNKFGNEKGVVVEFFKKDSKSFYFDYSPVCIINDELADWKNKIIEKHTANNSNIMYSSFSYWHLEEVSCIPIYRNQEWFNEAKVILGEFWNKVLKYRELGLAKLYEDLQSEKDEKKQIRLMKKEETITKKESLKKERALKKEDSTKKQKKIREFIILDDITDESTKIINKIDFDNDNDDNKLSENSSNNDTEENITEDEDDFVFQTQTNTSLFSSKSIFN